MKMGTAPKATEYAKKGTGSPKSSDHANARRRAMSHAQAVPSTLVPRSQLPHRPPAASNSAVFTKNVSDTQGLCQPGCGGPPPGVAVRSSMALAEYGPRAKSSQSPKTTALYESHTTGDAITMAVATQNGREPRRLRRNRVTPIATQARNAITHPS